MANHDSVLLLGNEDEKIQRFLGRLGYSLFTYDGRRPLPELLSCQAIDAIIVDARTEFDCVALCEYLRSDECARKIPLLYLGSNAVEMQKLKDLGYERMEFLEPPLSPGLVMSRLATQLRLRKFSGLEDRSAGMADVLIAQRDLTAHFTKELEEARSIQRSLLPAALPQDPRYHVAACYRPLDEVGGDWYHVSVEKSGIVILQVADVTGHGLSAALVSSMTRLAFYAGERTEVEKHLSGMNSLLTPQLPEGRFVTMASCFYDPKSGELQCARAGHPAVLHLSHTAGEVKKLCPDGFPVGLLEDADYGVAKTQMAARDLLVLYTDGLVEAQNRSFEQYGEQRLIESILHCAKVQSASEALQNIMREFESFIDGRRLKDDVTLVVLQRTA